MDIQFATMRERYILAQALSVAIRTLEQVEPPVMRELSNIADMKELLNNKALLPFNELMMHGELVKEMDELDEARRLQFLR